MAVGRTDTQGFIVLETVETLPPGSMVPLGQPIKVDSGERDEFHLEGTIDSIQASTLIVNGQVVNLENTKIEGTISVGTQVDVEGYFTSDGKFIAVKIEAEGSSSGDSGGDDSDSSDGGD